MLEALFQFSGRVHPMVLHLPIGLIAGLVALECFALVRRQPMPTGVRALLAWFVAATCVFSAASGLILSQEPAYGGDTLDLHKWLGIAVAVIAVLVALTVHVQRAAKFYAVLLLVAAGLLVPAGHFGASMTHGEGFLTTPFRAASGPRQNPVLAGNGASGETVLYGSGTFATQIAPIFAQYCVSCHGESTRKGKLALHTPEAIMAGGSTGSAIEPGDSEASELVFRLRMDLDEDGHMPPKNKPQLDAAAINAIAAWIDAGASFEGTPPIEPTEQDAAAATTTSRNPVPSTGPMVPPPEAVAALRAAHVHVETIDPATGLLWVSFAAVPGADDALARGLLAPLAPFIAELSLARTRIGDESLQLLVSMPRLRKLDLASTLSTSRGLVHLETHTVLEELNIAGTQMDDTAADSLLMGFPSLRRVFIWNANISPQAAESLRDLRPGLLVDEGDSIAAVLDQEPEPKFTSDAPPPGSAGAAADPAAAAPSSVDSLRPVNALCPVAGKPIDSRFALVHKGRVVAFCCADCVAAFLADPARYETAIK